LTFSFSLLFIKHNVKIKHYKPFSPIPNLCEAATSIFNPAKATLEAVPHICFVHKWVEWLSKRKVGGLLFYAD